MQSTVEIQLPFSGFYYSIHNDEADREVQWIKDWYSEETGENISDRLSDLIDEGANYGEFWTQYAQAYAKAFADEYLNGEAEFSGLTSPKYYNFETDRVFARVPLNVMQEMFANVDKDDLTRIAKERHTSRDGFISHYSPDWMSWGDLIDWDHNQFMTLILAHHYSLTGYDWEQMDEYNLMEDAIGNGLVSGALWTGPNADHALKIVSYLIERSKRPVKTMQQWRIAFAKPWETTPLAQYVPSEL